MRSNKSVLAAALLPVVALGVACSAGSPPAADDAQAPLPPITNSDASSDAPSSAAEAGAVDGSPPPSDAGGPDATLDGAADATEDGNTGIGADAAPSLATGCRSSSPDDGGFADAGALPGCGTWVSASAPGARIEDTVQLTTTGRGTGLGAVVDWNTTGGTGSGEFTDASAAGATFTCLTPGTVIVTATDPAGADCGSGTYDQASVAIECDASSGPWAAVSISSVSGCGVTTAGSVRCWSDESGDGVLGNGTTTPSAFPVQVTGLTSGVSSVAVGSDFACALTAGGAVQCWGALPRGGLGNEGPVTVANLSSGATALAAGGQSACAITASHGVLCWGSNASGELGNGTTSDSAAAVPVTGLTGTTATLAVGNDFACAASTTGAVQCWGDDSSGELGNGSSAARFIASPVAVVGLPAPITAVTAGGAFACALTSAGDVDCWGANDSSQLGNFSGSTSPTPVHVGGLPQDIRAIAAGQSFACALAGSGAVLCWGNDAWGQLGNGSFGSSSASPLQVSGLTGGVASISLGGQSACAITFAGDLLCWGSNDVAQIGDPPPTFCSLGVYNTPACAPYPTSIEGAGPGAIACGPAAPVDGGEPDAASGWCQQQGTHTLCEDFDQGVPGKLSPQLSAGSTIGEDDAPSRALLATTSPISPQDVESTAFGTYVSPVAGPNFRVQADFKIGSDCFASGYRPVTLVRVDYLDVGYTLAYSASPASSGAGWVMQLGDTESTSQTPGPFSAGAGSNTFIPTDQWARLTLWADVGSKVGGYGVQLLAPNGPGDSSGGGISGSSQTPASAPVLRIGVDAATHGCSVDIDNVLFDVNP